MSTGRPNHYGHLLQVWKESLQPLTLYTSFHDVKNVYSRRSGQSTPGDKIFMSTETSCHFGHLLQVSKTSLWSLILCNFFHDVIHVCSPGAGADNLLGTKFWCQQEHLVTSVICCKFKKISLILYNCFHDFIHVYSLGAGAESPPGDKVLMSTEMSCHFIHLLQLSKFLWSLILYNFFMI